MSAEPISLAVARASLGLVSGRAQALLRALPAHLSPEAAHRVERAIAEADHALTVAATAAGLVRAGGGDAR